MISFDLSLTEMPLLSQFTIKKTGQYFIEYKNRLIIDIFPSNLASIGFNNLSIF